MTDPDQELRLDFEQFRKRILPDNISEEDAAEYYAKYLDSPSIDEQINEYVEQDAISQLQTIEQTLAESHRELQVIDLELSEEPDKTSLAYKSLLKVKNALNKKARNTINELSTEALTSNRFNKVKGLQSLIKGSTQDDLTNRMFWDYYYKLEDEELNPSKYKFLPIDLGDKLPEAAVKYIQGLYARTIPVPSEIFKRDPCLVWCGAKDVDGYAKHKPPKDFKGSTLVHRFIYQAVHGELGEATIDHACSKVDCVNLRHLRLLDRATNKAYGDHRKFIKGE